MADLVTDGIRGREREAAVRLGLLLIGAGAALLLAEAAVRLAGVAPEVAVVQAGRFRLSRNPKLGYEPAPGVAYGGKDLDLYGFHGAGNRLGYRDRDHAVEKPPGTFRIVVLGDSIGVGLYVERPEEIFPAVLERLLLERGLRAEVINLSVSGYNTRQEVETLRERGLAYDPDLVVLAYCLNDRAPNDGGIMATLLDREAGSGALPPGRSAGRWLVRSALYRFLRYSVFPPAAARSPEERDRRLGVIAEDSTEESLHELARLAREHGFRVLVAVFPELTDLADYRYEGEHVRIANISKARGFEYVDLLRTFRYCEAIAEGEIGYDRYHPTPPGHLCAAGAIADFIQEERLDAPRPRRSRAPGPSGPARNPVARIEEVP